MQAMVTTFDGAALKRRNDYDRFEVVIYAPLGMRHRAYDKPGSVLSS
jgi:hypothetical protein